MTTSRGFAPEPSRRQRGVIPFPIIGPGCCGCGFIATALLVVGSIGAAAWLDDAPAEAQPHPETGTQQGR